MNKPARGAATGSAPPHPPIGAGWNHALVERVLKTGRFGRLYSQARSGRQGSVLEGLLEALSVTYQASDEDMRRIPQKGPVLVVANHPFGMLEGAILGSLLLRARPDLKVVTNYLLSGIPELRGHCIFVDPFQHSKSKSFNYRAMKESLQWLRQGGMLVVFPAGAVSELNFLNGQTMDPAWSEHVARLARLTRAAVLPVFFKGRNSVPFHALGRIHPLLRTVQLPKELMNKAGQAIEVRIGAVVPGEAIAAMPRDQEAIRYLRWRTYLLAGRGEPDARLLPKLMERLRSLRPEQPVADPGPEGAIIEEIRNLSAEHCVLDSGEFRVYLAAAPEIPAALRELGRLRELTFREVGEGTGNPLDLDRFDAYYRHLLLWHTGRQELAGAYRIGDTRRILPRLGIAGLYTSTLFEYDRRFFEAVGPALELGRSFVRAEYQRQYAPLLLLWKGLGQAIARDPGTPILFGAVSISNDYSRSSRDLIAHFFHARRDSGEMARLVRPKHPFRPAAVKNWDGAAIAQFFRDLDSLSGAVADLERDHKGVPVLLRQYAKLGGSVLGFNVDANFSNALDGLILVDLRRTDAPLLERYMTKEGATRFREVHGLLPMPNRAV